MRSSSELEARVGKQRACATPSSRRVREAVRSYEGGPDHSPGRTIHPRKGSDGIEREPGRSFLSKRRIDPGRKPGLPNPGRPIRWHPPLGSDGRGDVGISCGAVQLVHPRDEAKGKSTSSTWTDGERILALRIVEEARSSPLPCFFCENVGYVGGSVDPKRATSGGFRRCRTANQIQENPMDGTTRLMPWMRGFKKTNPGPTDPEHPVHDRDSRSLSGPFHGSFPW